MVRNNITLDPSLLATFCEKHHIRRLSLFGSVLRDDFRPDSDVDMLVEFDPEHVPGFIGLCEMEFELGDRLGGRRIDLVTSRALNHLIRERVLNDAAVIYAS